MGKGLSYWVYRAVRGMASLIFPKPEYIGMENVPEGPCVLVCNHAQMYGPVYAEVWLTGKRAIWCNGEMMHAKEVPGYAMSDFWGGKPAWSKWFWRIMSYVIAPIAASVFSNANCIGVYRDARLKDTFRESLEALGEGARVVIFPDCYTPHNEIIYEFQDRFIALGRMYHRQTGQSLAFVPMYAAPTIRKVVIGQPIFYDGAAKPDEERARICDRLMEDVTALAKTLPRHRVIPFPNLPKREWNWSLPEGRENEGRNRG